MEDEYAFLEEVDTKYLVELLEDKKNEVLEYVTFVNGARAFYDNAKGLYEEDVRRRREARMNQKGKD